MFKFKTVAIFISGVIVLSIMVICLYKYNQNIMNIFIDIEQKNNLHMDRLQRQVQELDAGISFDVKRKKLILGLRDIILSENKKLEHIEAYSIAEATVNECDKYDSVSPILLTAIQKVESNFITIAESKQGALGLNQIWPPTGRMLCRIIDWEYSSNVLLDFKKNTRLAVLYLNILSTEYDDIKIVVAAYNGGPQNAHYWLDGKKQETKDYVKRVFTFYEKYKKTINTEA